MNKLETEILAVLNENYMTITCVIDRIKKTANTTYNDELVSLYCGMLIGEEKVDSLEIQSKNGAFYAIRKKQ